MSNLRKSSRLAKTKQVEPEVEEREEDDDAPEEIGLNVGREKAIRKIEEEKEGGRAAKATKRDLAAKRQQKGQPKQPMDEQKEAGAQPEEDEVEAEAHGSAREDVLPASILAAIEERKRAQDRAHEQASVITAALKSRTKSSKLKKGVIKGPVTHGLFGVKSGPLKKGSVQVQVLSLQARLAAASHGNFRKDKTMGEGSGVKRSLQMLRPASASRRGPAAQFSVNKGL